MGNPDLLMVCVAAIVAVFVMLSVLAGVIRILTLAFPGLQPPTIDSTVVAAVSAAVAATHPGTRISRIEETS